MSLIKQLEFSHGV